MQAKEQLERIRTLVLEARKLLKQREQLVKDESSTEEIDARIAAIKCEYNEIYSRLTPLIQKMNIYEFQKILFMFYYEAAPMKDIVTTVLELPPNSTSISLAQSRKRMSINYLQLLMGNPKKQEGKQ